MFINLSRHIFIHPPVHSFIYPSFSLSIYYPLLIRVAGAALLILSRPGLPLLGHLLRRSQPRATVSSLRRDPGLTRGVLLVAPHLRSTEAPHLRGIWGGILARCLNHLKKGSFDVEDEQLHSEPRNESFFKTYFKFLFHTIDIGRLKP